MERAVRRRALAVLELTFGSSLIQVCRNWMGYRAFTRSFEFFAIDDLTAPGSIATLFPPKRF
jgi:hypothetical protein